MQDFQRDMVIARALKTAFTAEQLSNFFHILYEDENARPEFDNLAVECDMCPHLNPFGECAENDCIELTHF